MLGVSLRTLMSLVTSGEIPHTRIGERNLRFPLDALREWVWCRSNLAHPVSSRARIPGEPQQVTQGFCAAPGSGPAKTPETGSRLPISRGTIDGTVAMPIMQVSKVRMGTLSFSAMSMPEQHTAKPP